MRVFIAAVWIVFCMADPIFGEFKILRSEDAEIGDLNFQRFSAGSTVVVAAAYRVQQDLVIPENVALVFGAGGKFLIGDYVTVRICGGIQGPVSTIFEYSGANSQVTFGSEVTVLPQWWGAVGNGVTDDTTAIQRAIDSLEVKGSRLEISKGVFAVSPREDNEIRWKDGIALYAVRLRDDIFIQGSGVIKLRDGDYSIVGEKTNKFPVVFGHDPSVKRRIDNCTIDGITVDGNRHNVQPQPVGAVLESFSNFTMMNCSFLNIHVARLGDSAGNEMSNRFLFLNNRLENTYTLGMFYVESAYLAFNQAKRVSEFVDLQGGCRNVMIEWNQVKGYNDTWPTMDAIFEVNASEQVFIMRNTVSNSSRSVLVSNKEIPPDSANKSNAVCKGVRITGNDLENALKESGATIFVGLHRAHGTQPHEDITIKDNFIKAYGQKYGIFACANNITVRDNQVEGLESDSYSGIYVHSADDYLDNIRISGNKITGGGSTGISVLRPMNFHININEIEAFSSQSYGILVREALPGAFKREVLGNSIYGAGRGIRVKGEGMDQDCKVSGNAFIDCGAEQDIIPFCKGTE